jgi:hypothetical protein
MTIVSLASLFRNQACYFYMNREVLFETYALRLSFEFTWKLQGDKWGRSQRTWVVTQLDIKVFLCSFKRLDAQHCVAAVINRVNIEEKSKLHLKIWITHVIHRPDSILLLLSKISKIYKISKLVRRSISALPGEGFKDISFQMSPWAREHCVASNVLRTVCGLSGPALDLHSTTALMSHVSRSFPQYLR